MKKIKYLIIIGLVVLIQRTNAQEIINPDSLIINYKNVATICLATDCISKLDKVNDINSVYKSFVLDFKLIRNSIPDTFRYVNIQYIHKDGEENIINVSENIHDRTTFYFGENNDYIKYQLSKYTINITLEKRRMIIIKVNDLDIIEELQSKDLSLLLKSSEDLLGKEVKKRIGMNFYFDHNGENIVENSKKTKTYHKPMDQIELVGGAGVSLDQHIWVPDFNARIAFTFAKKGVHKDRYLLSLQWKYFFDENPSGKTDININPYLNIGYERNFSNDPSSPNWYGIYVGYLLKERGGHYDDDTFKVSVGINLTEKIKFYPEMYIGKVSYPGIRVGFSF